MGARLCGSQEVFEGIPDTEGGNSRTVVILKPV